MSMFVVGTMACVGALLAAERRGLSIFAVILKPLASMGFLGAAISAGALGHPPGVMLFVGLLASLAGDVFLLRKSSRGFVLGLGSFLVAHLFFTASFYMRGVTNLGLTLAAFPLLIVLLRVNDWLMPFVDERLKTPVLIYMLTLALMVAASAGAWAAGGSIALFIGAVLFLVSDLFVARERFIAKGFNNRLVGLPLYYAAQLLLASASG